MDQILELPIAEQQQIFQEAAAQSPNIKRPIVIEKDFWVCWTLEKIFSAPDLSPYITFKGGTSLSKCYDIINRFSEDCDLTLSKNFLGIDDDIKTLITMGSKQKGKFKKKITKAAEEKVTHYIKPELTAIFKTYLNNYFKETEWSLESDPQKDQNLLFHYPTRLEKNPQEYIQSVVKLEFGARGDSSPNEQKEITPFIYQILPTLFTRIPLISVHTLTAQRTFWEKITLLHAEHHHPLDKPLKNRMFRHYYDVVMLDEKGITEQALNDISLLDDVLINKKNLFTSGWANYESAQIGTLCLCPNDKFIETLRQDCNRMSEMFFGEAPNFEEVMDKLKNIENMINKKI